MTVTKYDNNKKYKLVAPDGGWGYMICIAFIINTTTVTAFIQCFGMLYNDFIKEKGMNSTTVTFVTGLNAFSFATAGFFTNSFLKLVSFRKLSLMAAILHNAGVFCTVFVDSVPLFFLFQGVFTGIGLAITYNLSCSILNDYFVERKMFAFSLVQFFPAVLGLAAPMFVKWSLQEYGYRGTVLLVAGVMLHNIIGVFLMQPVQWHMKRVEVLPSTEIKPLLVNEKTNTQSKEKPSDEESAAISQPGKVNNEKKSAIMRVVNTFVDVSFAKKYILSSICIGPAVCAFADGTFALILPQALYTLNWNQEYVALAISIYAFGDLAMRTALIFLSPCLKKIGTQEIYIIGIMLGCVSRLGMLWSEHQYVVLFYIFLMGISRCIIIVLLTVVISEVLIPEKFTEAMGITMMFTGFTVLLLAPAVGAIRDLTNSYDTAFYLLTSCFLIIALFWSIELCYKKNKEKRKIQKENLEKIKLSRSNKRI